MAFFFRLVMAAGLLLIYLAIFALIITVVNFALRWFGELVGWNIGNFWEWLASKLPKRKKKAE